MKEELARTLAMLPDKPGVYIMHDDQGKIIYVGKALVLKNRVRSYFHDNAQHSVKVRALVAKVAEIETIVTATEMEALVLECNLIKQYRPRYNICLKDDKSYPYLKITVQDEFPRVFITRNPVKDGSKYYGPFPNVGTLHTNLKIIRTLFPLRTCRSMKVSRPCLQYHIKHCLAPCTGFISAEKYREMIDSVIQYMDGKTAELEKTLKQRMKEAAEDLRYEEAADYRDLLRAVVGLQAEQKAVSGYGDQDVIAMAEDETGFCVQVFFVRGGKMVGRDNFFLSAEKGSNHSETINGFLKQYYNQASSFPREVLLGTIPEEQELLEQWLGEKAGHKVELLCPQRGLKHDLVKMVEENATKSLRERLRQETPTKKSDEDAAAELQEALGLTEPLQRVDCFDISHTQGAETVASMVVFRDGSASKRDYRHYKIRSTEGKPDDFKSMQEVVYRRYRDGENLPSLIVIDGGKGQLSSALTVIRGLGLHEVPVIALAEREEEIFIEGNSEPLVLDKTTAALKLIQRIRDEAHRFAITYHRKLRGKRNLVSVLDHIDGVGPTRRKSLWQQFKTLDAMEKASVEELAAVKGMNRSVAQKLYTFFHSELEAKKNLMKI